MTRAGFNEGGNIIACNTLSNQTTNISLGASTFDSVLDNQQANGAAIVLANAGGTGNVIRRVIATPAVTGTKGGNAALASLLTALAAYGLVTDSTT
jgi:hypothetical protein